MCVSRIVGAIVMLTFVVGVCSGMTVNKTKQINNTYILENRIHELQSKVKQLQNQITQLQLENERLKFKIQQLEKWDVRKLMDELFIYHITPEGKKYDLLFHEGGLGGVAVYQYVGPWLGDAGKWRQYKQIAQLKTSQLQHGYIKPGVVLKPVWGFNKTNITIRSIADIIRLENELNSINGLAKYFEWVRDKYVESSRYNIGILLACCTISLIAGLVFGETIRPIYKLSDRVTTGAMTYWGEKRRGVPKLLILIISAIVGYFILQQIMPPLIAGILVGVFLIVLVTFCKASGMW